MIDVVDTPNPDTKKFVFDKTIVAKGSKEFKKKDGSVRLVDDLFNIGEIELTIYKDKKDSELTKNWCIMRKPLMKIKNFKKREDRTFLLYWTWSSTWREC